MRRAADLSSLAPARVNNHLPSTLGKARHNLHGPVSMARWRGCFSSAQKINGGLEQLGSCVASAVTAKPPVLPDPSRPSAYSLRWKRGVWHQGARRRASTEQVRPRRPEPGGMHSGSSQLTLDHKEGHESSPEVVS
jgi:hypothetical protein